MNIVDRGRVELLLARLDDGGFQPDELVAVGAEFDAAIAFLNAKRVVFDFAVRRHLDENEATATPPTATGEWAELAPASQSYAWDWLKLQSHAKPLLGSWWEECVEPIPAGPPPPPFKVKTPTLLSKARKLGPEALATVLACADISQPPPKLRYHMGGIDGQQG